MMNLKERAQKILLSAMEDAIRAEADYLDERKDEELKKKLLPALEKQFGRVVKLFGW